MKKKKPLNYPRSAAIGFFSKGLKDEFETAVVNEPSVFEPFKFYCIWSEVTKTIQEKLFSRDFVSGPVCHLICFLSAGSQTQIRLCKFHG